jgi:hypothetical protein
VARPGGPGRARVNQLSPLAPLPPKGLRLPLSRLPLPPRLSAPSARSEQGQHLEQSGFEVDEVGQALRRKPPQPPHRTPEE